MTRIIEVLRRSEQGKTRPFLCRSEAGDLYYVKGRGAGFEALVREWIAGRLGQYLNLPLAPFQIVEVPAALVNGSAMPEIHDLGIGAAFGSQQIPYPEELNYEHLDIVIDTYRDITEDLLLFDWWICNPDRTLHETGGNPNLLWTSHDRELHIIDHNLAFSPHNMADFKRDHVFKWAGSAWDAPHWQAVRRKQMRAALDDLPVIWDEAPERWIEVLEETDSEFTLDFVHTILERFETDPHFWEYELPDEYFPDVDEEEDEV